MFSITTASALLLIVVPIVSSQQCYYPDGSFSDQIACSSGIEPTWCCDPGFACLSNGLCQDRSNTGVEGASLSDLYDRGSCTDPTWSSPNCLTMCSSITPNGGAQVWSCSADKTTYCCDTVPGGAYQDSPNCCGASTEFIYTLASPHQIPYDSAASSSSSTSDTPAYSTALPTTASSVASSTIVPVTSTLFVLPSATSTSLAGPRRTLSFASSPSGLLVGPASSTAATPTSTITPSSASIFGASRGAWLGAFLASATYLVC